MVASFSLAKAFTANRSSGSSSSVEGTAAIGKEMASVLPPLLLGAALILGTVVVARLCLAGWARWRSRRQHGALPEQQLFPPPSHHERLRDPRYLSRILDGDTPDSPDRRP